ncbi:histocompatibility antigen 60b-like isoform X1 [Arvicanthis niloticus]|uniref:histocompatibility antigen 60b-like isoform X1 n=1 Tax=Arvicanthis niloticus TaxID=61156 RepID=UPI00402B1766
MAKRATSTGSLSLNRSLLVLLNFLGTTLSTGPDSLSCNFIVKHRASTGQCSVNGKPLFYFDYEKQKGNATEVCADLYQSLKDTFDTMTNLESERFKTEGDHSLQVTIQSQYNQGEFIGGLWAFTIDEQYSFYFYPNNTWRESHSNAIKTMKKWENNRELSQNLRKLSTGDFTSCLKKPTHSREMPRSTMKMLDTTQPTYATQMHPIVNTTQPTYGTHNQPTANITQVTFGTQSLSITVTVIGIVGGLFVISMAIFCFNKMLKKKKQLLDYDSPWDKMIRMSRLVKELPSWDSPVIRRLMLKDHQVQGAPCCSSSSVV